MLPKSLLCFTEGRGQDLLGKNLEMFLKNILKNVLVNRRYFYFYSSRLFYF
jgi:hypothetical protein